MNLDEPKNLKKFAELGHVHRTEPCQEYPGTWMVYYTTPAKDNEFPNATYADAHRKARQLLREYDWEDRGFPLKLSICWMASENDPRIGEVWFTGFYQHGKFNQFGEYKT